MLLIVVWDGPFISADTLACGSFRHVIDAVNLDARSAGVLKQ